MTIDYKRYDRQIALPQIDLDGQHKLAEAHIVIVGVGGLGCAAAQSLALMGVGRFTLIDHDKVELSNLARQALFDQSDIGKMKVEAAAQTLQTLNPTARINWVDKPFDAAILAQIQQTNSDISVVLDCTDNLSTRLSVNQVCRAQKLPLIIGAAIRFEGMLCFVSTQAHSPCYECLSKVWPDPNESCVERGIFTPVVNIIGHYQALLAGQYLVGLPVLESGKVMFFDSLKHTWRTFNFAQSTKCSSCGE